MDYEYCPGDSVHEIVTDIKLAGNAELHRFTNGGGYPYSAIYLNGVELKSSERNREKFLIDDWNTHYDAERDYT